MEQVIYKRKEKRGRHIVCWKNMKAESEGLALECASVEILSVSFDGEFGGGEAFLEGAIGDQFHYLVSPNGGFISARQGGGVIKVDGRYVNVKPVMLGGSDKTKVKVTILGQEVRA
jgi:hypothetical protein